MDTKALTFIKPLEDYTNKFNVKAEIRFLTGERKGKKGIYEVTTDIFKYYFFGVTLEVVEFDKIGNIINIRDVKSDEFEEFHMGLLKTYSFNIETTDMLCSNGFVYILNQSKLWRDYPEVCQNIMNNMMYASNFVMYTYTMNNTLLMVNVEFNLKPNDKRYKKAIHRGFITADKDLLKMMSPPEVWNEADPNEKLKQEDIDRLIKEMAEK